MSAFFLRLRILTVLHFFLGICTFSIAQSDTTSVDSIRVFSEDERDKPLGDTTSVLFYYLDENNIRAIDTSLAEFEYPNFFWRMPNGGLLSDLGHPGTALFPLIFETSAKAGFRTGTDIFSNYRLRPNDIPIYEIGEKKPFTDLFYSQINMQHVLLRANFAHQVTDNLYYSLHYSLLNYNSYFQGHRSRHQDIALNLRYQKGQYTSYITFVNNANNQSENGGLVNDVLSLTDMLFLNSIPVQLNVQNNGSPKHENRHQQINYYHFLKNDSDNSKSIIGHIFRFENNRYKFFDSNPDSVFYKTFQTNNRGLRHFVQHVALDNEINWQRAFGGNLIKTPLLFKVFIGHSWNRVDQEPELFTVNNFYVGAEIRDKTDGPISYLADTRLVNSRLGIDFWIRGKVNFKIKDFISVGSSLLFQRYEPAQTARQFYISQTRLWDNINRLSQSQDFTLRAFLAWPKFWGRFDMINHTLTKAVYYDENAFVQQMSGTANILILKLKQDVHLWKFHLENEVFWQRVLKGSTVFRLPEFVFKNKLYFESGVFKTVRLRTGLSFRYVSSYFANAYFPILGSFYIQDNQKINYLPQADVFISAKIWQLRFFINAENLTYYLNESQNYFVAPHYAVPNWFIRFGASWQLFD